MVWNILKPKEKEIKDSEKETKEEKAGWFDKFKQKIGIFKREETPDEKETWVQKLKNRLGNTRKELSDKINRLFYGSTEIDEEFLEQLEEILITSDVGIKTTEKICEYLKTKAVEQRFLPNEVFPFFKDHLKDLLAKHSDSLEVVPDKLNIMLMVGVNGTGKTTTIGKIASLFKESGYNVIIAGADTFRAAATEQLDIWAKRANVEFIHHQEGGDAAAVVFDAIQAAKARKADILLVDTAGRLHNKTNLMEELRKIRRIIDREAGDANIESLLVLDAVTGQNGLNQAEIFKEVTTLTGVILTKLDGTAKGGIIFAIGDTLKIPIKLIGVGETIEDLREFDPQIYVDALFMEKS